MRRRLVLTLLVAVMSTTGCGKADSSSNGPTRSATVTLSKGQLIAKADAICRRMNNEFATDEPKDQGIAETARITPHRAVLEQRVVDELNSLKPRAEFAGQVRRVISMRKTLAEELVEVAADAKTGNTTAVHKLAASKAKRHHELQAFATATGFKICGQVG